MPKTKQKKRKETPMSKIQIRGVLVPSSYDAEWAAAYIDKGMFMPESRVRSMISAASKSEPLLVYINSPGGSVFAGNEMINAINTWAAETSQPVEITVGAMAASMAAAMLVQTSAIIKAHKNSKIMYHGAWCEVVAGEEGMKDQSELLGKINADIKGALVAKTKLDPEKIEEGFAEGRQLWLTAQEAKDAGIVAEIIDAEDKKVKFAKSAMNALSERGMKLAAIDGIEVEDEAQSNTQTEKTEEVKPANVAESTIPEAVNEVALLSDKINKMTAEARMWQGRHDQVKAQLDKAIADHAQEVSNLSKQIEDVGKEKAELSSRLARLSLQAAALPEKTVEVGSWVEALKVCNADYAKAKARFPKIHAAYFAETQKK
jgi:ATP-dependent Clp protease protease subunit